MKPVCANTSEEFSSSGIEKALFESENASVSVRHASMQGSWTGTQSLEPPPLVFSLAPVCVEVLYLQR